MNYELGIVNSIQPKSVIRFGLKQKNPHFICVFAFFVVPLQTLKTLDFLTLK